jgi:phosphate-selective porin
MFELQYAWSNLELLIQHVSADSAFRELELQINQPKSSSLQLGWYITDKLRVAWRYQRSAELEEAPETENGLGLVWHPVKQLRLAVEYLQADFPRNWVTDDDDHWLRQQQTLQAQISWFF